MLDKEQIQRNLNDIDTAIDIVSKAREDALKAKTECATRIEMSEKALAKHGITPENAEAKLSEMEVNIETMIKELKGKIPIELLSKLNRMPEDLKARLV